MSYVTILAASMQSTGSAADSNLQLTVPSQVISSAEVTSTAFKLAAGEILDLSSILSSTLNGQKLVQYIFIKGTGNFDVSTAKDNVNVDMYTGTFGGTFLKILGPAGTAITHLKIKADSAGADLKCLIGHGI